MKTTDQQYRYENKLNKFKKDIFYFTFYIKNGHIPLGYDTIVYFFKATLTVDGLF
jgi:hypothetical protein